MKMNDEESINMKMNDEESMLIQGIRLIYIMRDFENIKSQDKLVLYNANNNDDSSNGANPESVVLESSAKPRPNIRTNKIIPGKLYKVTPIGSCYQTDIMITY